MFLLFLRLILFPYLVSIKYLYFNSEQLLLHTLNKFFFKSPKKFKTEIFKYLNVAIEKKKISSKEKYKVLKKF
jgi:hypothetical protein